MLGGVWLLYFCFGVTVSSLAPLVRPVTNDLSMGYAAMGTVLGIWQLVYIFTALPCGALIDRVGLRRSLILCAVVMALSCALRGFAVNHLTLLLAVALFGFGGPLVSIGAPKRISLWFKGRERGWAMGIYVTGPALGGIASLSLTNSVMMPWQDGNWRAVLFIYASLSLVAGLLWILISSHPASHRMESSQRNQERPPQLQVFRDLFKLAPVRILLLMSIGSFLYNHGLSNWLHEILQTRGLDAEKAGYWASLPTLVGILCALVIPRMAVPERRILVLASLFACSSVAVLFLKSGSEIALLAGLVMKGVTQGSLMTVLLLTLMEIPGVGSRYTGSAGGMFFSAAEIGGVLGPVSLGVWSDATGSFQGGLTMLSLICLLMVLLAFSLKRMLPSPSVD